MINEIVEFDVVFCGRNAHIRDNYGEKYDQMKRSIELEMQQNNLADIIKPFRKR